ncbi:MAG: polyprenyl synthetase family protein [Flavobacteriaceae bacterium]|nr:polyprenyl synthetase family protein [Flavobacteriaceae bacterium]
MDFLKKYQNIISENIEKYQFKQLPSELYTPLNYIISIGGKRLRPTLLLMSCEAFGGDVQKAIKPALAIEFFHNFTLIHDDIMDNAPLRRGNATIHALHGINTGILSGDALFIKSYQFFEDLEPNLFKNCIQLFSETGALLCEGQQMDINFETSEKVNYDDYIQMITNKTGVLTAGSLKIGAIIANASEQDANAIYEFGKHIGIAFQMMDDYLDVFGNQEFGKKEAGDITENKKTILYLLAEENANSEDLQELKNWYSTKEYSEEKIQKVKEIFKRTNADELTLKHIEKHNDLAQNSLNSSSLSEEKKKIFIELANYLLNRNI